jgi:hypothetical protein
MTLVQPPLAVVAGQGVAADSPVELNEFTIDRQSRPKPRATDWLFQLGKQRGAVLW